MSRLHLLEAADIVADPSEGEQHVSNGLALRKLHSRSVRLHILGVRPDCVVEVRIDVLEEIDGPMLKHGLQGFHGLPLLVPSRASQQPDRGILEERYAIFRTGS